MTRANRYAYLLRICTRISAIRTTSERLRASPIFGLASLPFIRVPHDDLRTVAFIKAAIHDRQVLVSVPKKNTIIR